jgi:YidC/Oxa1 family membrane protein insertase
MKDVIHGIYGLTVSMGFPSYALAIIILGIIVRVLLLPLSIKQMKSMLGMSEIQPELQQLQKQYANNREKLAQEMNRLYEEYDVHPMAGCLPMLIQMPILYALFRAMREYNFEENASFFWIQSLNNTDSLFILPVALGLVMFAQQKLAMPKESLAANPSMKMMVYVMPVMMAVMGVQFPSGLCLYWITTSALMVFQQLYMNSLRKKELAKRAELRAQREAQRQVEQKEQAKKGQNPSKRKTKQQLKNEHKARKRDQKVEDGTYKAPSKKGSGATYHPPKANK